LRLKVSYDQKISQDSDSANSETYDEVTYLSNDHSSDQEFHRPEENAYFSMKTHIIMPLSEQEFDNHYKFVFSSALNKFNSYQVMT